MMRPGSLKLLRHLSADRKGAAAVEFALLIFPLSLIIFAIIEVSVMFFAASSLDASVQKISRMIRTGEALSANMTLTDFKAKICADMTLTFSCSDNLLIRVDVISNLSAVTSATPIDSSGNLKVTEAFATGKASDYMLVQAFLPWSSVVNYFTYSSAKLADGRYLLGATVLFRNEPS
ncbi:TadE/TadG family type IV pilus assembly protein [Rhizobium rhizogenes]|uniref:TadE/TadG family type IV pilus assembly protein n=1 Tax=Rhizobium rhizogenes TaxID=359 RepID=UPI00157229A7|nr:TadE/TadG family type IV pilus assembly protein [Rhizobium rhizogenes]NTF45996.1 pilus assembly protein [Rhizobium rhizogenes]